MPFNPWSGSGSSSGTAVQPWQFAPETYGAKGDVRMLYDVTANNGSAVITTAGLPAPSVWPGGSQITGSASGGSLAAGVYQVRQTYVNQYGETLGSTASSYTAAGGASSIASNTPAPWTNATGFNTYCTIANGATFFKQNTTPTPLRSTFTITSINAGGANPPGSNTSNSAPFLPSDPGKYIIIPSAGGFLNVPLVTTIASYQSATQVTLTVAATRSVSSQGAVYGTDDTAAVQAAINAAVAYAQTGGVEPDADVDVVLNGTYAIAGAPGGVNMSAQIQIPAIDPYVGPKVNLRFVTPQKASGPPHWEQPNPPMPRGTLVSIYYNDSAGGAGPPPNVIVGGPVTGYTGNLGLFSNMRVSGDINFLAAFRPCIAGLDLVGCAQADMNSVGYFCMAATATAAGGWPPYTSGTANASAWQMHALRMPGDGNNVRNTLGRLTVYGPWYGVNFTDHFSGRVIECIFCWGATHLNPGATLHHTAVQSLVSEATSRPIYCDSGAGKIALFVASLQCENADFIIDDTNNTLQGEVHAEQPSIAGLNTGAKNGAANIRLVWDNTTLGHQASPPAVPASGTAQTNFYWQPATVVIHCGAGVTVSAITIDGVAIPTTVAASSSSPQIVVRNGGTITLTYAGGTPTWDWWIG